MGNDELQPISALERGVAAEHVFTRVPIAPPSAPIEQVRQALGEGIYDSLTHVAILVGTKLVGVLTIESLFSAPNETAAEQVMDPDPPVVGPGTDQEVAAWRAVEHGESALAVVDAEGDFVGFIPPHRLLAVLLWEHEEDMDRLGGLLRSASEARGASQEPVGRRFLHRIPWLFVGLVGALLSADIVGAFEEQLKETVVLAFFVPGIVYLADAVGTQTETVVIRGLSVGVGLRQMVRPELLSGLLMGLALSSVFFPVALLRWGDTDVAIAVSLSVGSVLRGDARRHGAPLDDTPPGKGPGVRQWSPGYRYTGPALDPHILRDRSFSRRITGPLASAILLPS